MQVTLSAQTTYTVVQPVVKSFSALTIQRMVDLPAQKQVKVFTSELPEPVLLWSGATYDSIGQWTNEDVVTRIQQLFQ